MALSMGTRVCVLLVFFQLAIAGQTVYDLLADLPFCALTCTAMLPMNVCGFNATINFQCQCTAPGESGYNNAMAMCLSGIGGCSSAETTKYHRLQHKICSVYQADPAAATLTATTQTIPPPHPTPGKPPGASSPTPGTTPGAANPTSSTHSKSKPSSIHSKSKTSSTHSKSKTSSTANRPGSRSSSATHTSSSGTAAGASTPKLTPTSSSSSSGLSTGASAGIGVGVALGVILIAVAVAAFFILSRRRRRRDAGPAGPAYQTEPKLPDQGPHTFFSPDEVSGTSSPAPPFRPYGGGAGGTYELPAEPARQPRLAPGQIYELPAS